ncbi:ion transporter [Actinosynnema sp. NPDC047251]|uniref:Voltage-gated sodium channel n=1 Tax=Saccharothrix espanaensis (strain ATCC 51144 / DSM 44229 / JCM 9112 / NBRC 15066 / NRRL 15764) TaxID=1179773 RepID=K0K307_SACES|nr:ion transporter [Saccharothrix espanaensis]CCH31977.1 Voltage-gated sodium channel [Saccharothrix espanaensis DSM 44229]
MGFRSRVRAIVDNESFQQAIIAVIVVNAVVLGLQTSDSVVGRFGGLLDLIDQTALAVFTVELAARIYAHGARFFRSSWNWFDFVIVGVSLLPFGQSMAVLRSLRILRALRLVSMVPSMRRVISALVNAVPGIVALAGLLSLLLYVGGVMATTLFGERSPAFGDLGTTVLTLVQITTGDGWSDVMREVMTEYPLAWIFFLCYLLVGTFTMLNLFIAVVCSAMESEVSELTRPQVPAPRAESDAVTSAALLEEIRAVRAEIRTLQSETSAGEPAGRAQ